MYLIRQMNKIKKSNEIEFVKKIELELLSALFNYIVPFIDKKINIKTTQKERNQKTDNLENIVSNQTPKVSSRDIKELESLLLKNLGDNTKSSKSVRITSSDFVYSLTLRRQKTINEKSNKYSISIKYEEHQDEERLKVSVKKEEREIYFAEIINEKNLMKNTSNFFPNYGITLSYESNYSEERLTITYRQQLKSYMQQHIESKDDMTNRVPLKWLNILPETMMGGVLGFTYLGENFMARRADLTGKTARMVDIHESIHTSDEYETRVLTSWIMERVRSKYFK